MDFLHGEETERTQSDFLHGRKLKKKVTHSSGPTVARHPSLQHMTPRRK